MSLTQVRNLMDELGFAGMAGTLDEVLKQSQGGNLGFTEALDRLLHSERQYRNTQSLKSRVSRSKIRQGASMEEFDLNRKRNISGAQIKELATLEWCNQGSPLILIGPTGIGKTYLARALGLLACEHKKTVLFMAVTDFLENLAIARACNGYLKFREKLVRPDLLVLDDFGMRKFNSQEAEDLRDVIEHRSYGKATIITTQLPFKHWAEVIGDEIILDALVDRLESPGIVVDMSGDTVRKPTKKKLDS